MFYLEIGHFWWILILEIFNLEIPRAKGGIGLNPYRGRSQAAKSDPAWVGYMGVSLHQLPHYSQ
jgi:hypothetical protein